MDEGRIFPFEVRGQQTDHAILRRITVKPFKYFLRDRFIVGKTFYIVSAGAITTGAATPENGFLPEISRRHPMLFKKPYGQKGDVPDPVNPLRPDPQS